MFPSLSEAFARRSLLSSSSGSCHGSDVMWQEIDHTCGSVNWDEGSYTLSHTYAWDPYAATSLEAVAYS